MHTFASALFPPSFLLDPRNIKQRRTGVAFASGEAAPERNVKFPMYVCSDASKKAGIMREKRNTSPLICPSSYSRLEKCQVLRFSFLLVGKKKNVLVLEPNVPLRGNVPFFRQKHQKQIIL